MRICQSWATRRRAAALSIAFVALACLLLTGARARAEKLTDLSPQGYVNDYAGVIDAGSKDKLTQLCQEVDSKAGAQIAIVTIHTLDGGSIEDFTNMLFQKWGVGAKSTDRGVMILVVVDDHKYRTEVGYGLEPILPDGKVGGFGRQMQTLLRQAQYGGALLQNASQIASVIAQDRGVSLTQAAPAPQESAPDQNGQGLPPIFFFLLLFLFLGGFRFIFFILAALGWWHPRRSYRGGPWIGSGGGWGGGGFGGGGGGFGGFGGGSSGGGGASGGW